MQHQAHCTSSSCDILKPKTVTKHFCHPLSDLHMQVNLDLHPFCWREPCLSASFQAFARRHNKCVRFPMLKVLRASLHYNQITEGGERQGGAAPTRPDSARHCSGSSSQFMCHNWQSHLHAHKIVNAYIRYNTLIIMTASPKRMI